jgi:hypothetical protein
VFHLRQTLGFFLTGVVGSIVLGIMVFVLSLLGSMVFSPILFLIPLMYSVYGLGMLALWVMGLLAAMGGKMTPMPVVGARYQQWFATAFR